MIRILLLTSLVLTAPALAVQPAHWVHTNEADFKGGKFEGVVSTNLGDLKLSREVKTLLEQDPRIAAVYSIVEAPDGTLYAGTGPEGIVLRLKDGKVETALEIEDGASVFAMAVDRQGRLLIGASGNRARLLRVDRPGGDPTELLAPAGAQYIWAIAQSDDGTIYLATGPHGELHGLNPDGTSKVLLKTDERNFLSLAFDGKDHLYVGTDPNGLVYRVNRKTGELFVLYDAAEAEVGALAIDKSGNVYAGTSEAVEGMTGGLGDAGAGATGRPEGDEGGMPIPAQPPQDPQPPKLPDPNPSEPDPIPTTQPAARHTPSGMLAPLPPPEVDAAQAAAGEGALEGSRTRSAPERPLTPPLSRREREDDARNVAVGSAPPGVTPGLGVERLLTVALLAPAAIRAEDAQEMPGDPEPPDADPVPGVQPAQPVARPTQPTAATPQAGAEARPEGNAIYRIDPEGFVTEVFRGPVMILDLVEQDGRLIVGTGSEGHIYQIDPAAEETVVLADLEPQQVMALLPSRDGRIHIGLANTGGVASMSKGFAEAGTFTSAVLDATQAARFGKLRLDGSLPRGTSLQVSTRSGNVQEPAEKGWSAWSEPANAQRFLDITAPPARFLQYRLTFRTSAPDVTPVVDAVDVAYQVPNLPPQIQSVTVAPAGAPADAEGTATAAPPAEAPAKHTITWVAADPNSDALLYSVHFRQGSTGPWIELKDKLAEATFEWNTRSLADGRYFIRVTASDARANAIGKGKTAARVSDAVVIDNTPPVIGDLKWEQTAQGPSVTLQAVDRVSTVAAVEYAVNSAEDWQAVLSSDTIFDSPAEMVSFVIPDLKAGSHQVSIRATDAAGNRSFQTLQVTIEPAATTKPR